MDKETKKLIELINKELKIHNEWLGSLVLKAGFKSAREQAKYHGSQKTKYQKGNGTKH